MRDIKGEGDSILGRYVIDKVWVRMSVIYRVHLEDDESSIFIAKRVHPHWTEQIEILDWFAREVDVWGDISSDRTPYLVQRLTTLRPDVDGANYFFVEFIDGPRLNDVVRATPRRRLSYPQLLLWATQIARALQHVSEPKRNGRGTFVHRDLEGSNVLITREGVAKLNDWGLGKNLADVNQQLPAFSLADYRGGVGKPFCMPPEQFPPDQCREYGVSGDVYGFGAILTEMLGYPPNPVEEANSLRYKARSREDVNRCLQRYHDGHLFPALEQMRLSASLMEMIRRCLRVNPQERYQSFTEIVTALEQMIHQSIDEGELTGAQWHTGSHFIPDQRQTTCPVAERRQSLEPVDVDAYLKACGVTSPKPSTGRVFSAPATSPSAATIPNSIGPSSPPVQPPPPPSKPISSLNIPSATPAPPQRPQPSSQPAANIPSWVQDQLIQIPAGNATLGCVQSLVDELARKYRITGAALEQCSSPPTRQVMMHSYLIARTAVSNEQYARFVDATGWSRPEDWNKAAGRFGEFGPNDPVATVTHFDAETFCQWAGVRLPTNNEWERAARGPDGRTFPWGNEWNDQRCQCLERHRATGQQYVPVDALPESASPEGLLNTLGNVWEWVDGGKGTHKHTRGSAWAYQGDIYCLSWFRLPTDPQMCDNEVGFRFACDLPGSEAPGRPVEALDAVARVPAGTFSVGIDSARVDELASQHGLKETDVRTLRNHSLRQAQVDTFEIRVHPVTNQEYLEFTKSTGHPWPKHWSQALQGWSGHPFLLRYAYHPVVNVTYADATAYCDWRGVRLPTNEQWERAARGDDGRIYPWGDWFEPDRCNTLESQLGRTTRVDAHPSGASPCGCLDLTGNVHEWVAAEPGGACHVRGGGYEERGALQGLAFLKVEASRNIKNGEVGFRYVSS